MPALPSSTHEPTIWSGAAALARLAELGVLPDILEAALIAGDIAARQADVHSPVMAAGTFRWLETVRSLRSGLSAEGWTLNDDRNSPRSIDPHGAIAIVAVSGTVGTGEATGTPRTANPRGNASSRAIQINGQAEFDVIVRLSDMAAEKTAGVDTWYLLYYRAQGDELRAELSRPIRVSDRGVVDAWSERILLPAVSFGVEVDIPRDAGGLDDVDFDIAAR